MIEKRKRNMERKEEVTKMKGGREENNVTHRGERKRTVRLSVGLAEEHSDFLPSTRSHKLTFAITYCSMCTVHSHLHACV